MREPHAPLSRARRWLTGAVLTLAIGPAAAECTLKAGETVEELVLPLRDEIRHKHQRYFVELLQLALDHTESEYGPCRARLAAQADPQGRIYHRLAHGEGVHLIDATAVPERNQRFRPVRFPLLKGLMGYRIAFIRPDDQSKFDEVSSLAQLQRFRAGQGKGWHDVKVLRNHGLEVTASGEHEALYRMLRAGRFDFFPRGAQEVLSEAAHFDTEGLAIERSLVLAYPWPVYFYVNREHDRLARRLAEGLEQARASGAFERFFRQHPLVREVFEQLQLEQRRFIYLCHPYHDDPELLERNDLWLRPWPEDLCKRQTHATEDAPESA